MSTFSVNVGNLSPTTTEQALHDFFSFCGKITAIEKEEKTAKISFEKVSAAKTALMLNGGTLDGEHISVQSDQVHEDPVEHPTAPVEIHTPQQEDKPRAGIAAEYLAKGYILSDQILQRAIDIDAKQGISHHFIAYLNSLDHNLGERLVGHEKTISGHVQSYVDAGAARAREVDEKHALTRQATDYYTKAISSPWGKKVHEFYTTTSKQVLDIHEEAKRISETHKASQTPPTAPVPAAEPIGAPAPEKI
ncbi:hypothetical protein DACRYDRAFT_21444 [Dacryopinax primogenitus]|uniref:RRM domain-containing protein n=1 Tax=Dacryopinax primogenitus (strain DJM 731) TaxID=1858805 RepID=M5GAZ8_DACPD|nr:uncharacterized protein DACRYDRAFT_21444 [Dacryopinax primogenitus]EJU03162.1 hypothetical protein DACRYDRAFT_21444 [Dacryopinax primogenitus]